MARGACCTFEFCRVLPTRDDCEAQGGLHFLEGLDCSDVDCTFGVALGACCLPDGSCEFIPATSPFGSDELGCYDRGGDWAGAAVRCDVPDAVPPRTICDPEPPPPEGCIERRPDRGLGRPAWSANQCQNAILQPEEPAPDGDGDWSIVTPHKVRALPGDPLIDENPCAHHRGSIIIDGDGFARAAMCSRPVWSDEESVQWSLDDLHIADMDPNGLIDPGDAFWIGAYGAPLFTEAHLRSHKMRCNIPI